MHAKGSFRRTVAAFAARHGPLIGLWMLCLIGVAVGCVLLTCASDSLYASVAAYLQPVPLSTGFGGMLALAAQSALPSLLWLLCLFAAGLSVGGLPVSPGILLLYGMGTGLAAAYHFSRGWSGVGYTVLFVVPRTLVTMAALLPAAAETLRLSLRLCRQLAPHQGLCGGLWRDFRRYLIRYLLCVGVILAGSVADTLLRLWFYRYFV